MRFALTVLIALTGAVVSGMHSGIIPIPDQMRQAVLGLGGDPAQLKNLDIRSIRATYDSVMRQVTAPGGTTRAGFQAAVVPTPAPVPLPTVYSGPTARIVTPTQPFDDHVRDSPADAGRPANAPDTAPRGTVD
jgi:hypothetical protein